MLQVWSRRRPSHEDTTICVVQIGSLFIVHLQEDSNAIPDDTILDAWTTECRAVKKSERRKNVELTIMPVSTENDTLVQE